MNNTPVIKDLWYSSDCFCCIDDDEAAAMFGDGDVEEENIHSDTKEEEWTIVLKVTDTFKSTLMMESGSKWWNYIIEFYMKHPNTQPHPHVCEENTNLSSNKDSKIGFVQTAVFIENEHGIKKCDGKKLIVTHIDGLTKVRLVDIEYECSNDEELYGPT